MPLGIAHGGAAHRGGVVHIVLLGRIGRIGPAGVGDAQHPMQRIVSKTAYIAHGVSTFDEIPGKRSASRVGVIHVAGRARLWIGFLNQATQQVVKIGPSLRGAALAQAWVRVPTLARVEETVLAVALTLLLQATEVCRRH